jgi:hypothetical protein
MYIKSCFQKKYVAKWFSKLDDVYLLIGYSIEMPKLIVPEIMGIKKERCCASLFYIIFFDVDGVS